MLDKPYLDGKPAWVKSYSVTQKRGPLNKRVKSFKGEYAAQKFIEANTDKKYFIVEEYVDSGEKRGTKPNYNPDFSMVFPRMYSSTGSHIPEYKKWSNYKGFNSPTVYTSPILEGVMGRAEFKAHIENDLLAGRMEKAELDRVLRRLFADYGQRFDLNFELQSKDVLLVRNPETGQMNSAPLTNPQMRTSLAGFIVDQLEQGGGIDAAACRDDNFLALRDACPSERLLQLKNPFIHGIRHSWRASAFKRHSSNSASASESRVMAPPTVASTRPVSARCIKLRITTLRSQSPLGSTYPKVPL